MSAIGATAGAKRGEGPFLFPNGERCYGLRHVMHAAGRNLYGSTCPPPACQTPHRPTKSAPAAMRRAINSCFTSHGQVARRARSNSYSLLGVGYRSKSPACMRLRDIIDPKYLCKSFSRRHGQISPDVTHVAVKELIAKGGHTTIVSTHRGRGQDNRAILMLASFPDLASASRRLMERPLSCQ